MAAHWWHGAADRQALRPKGLFPCKFMGLVGSGVSEISYRRFLVKATGCATSRESKLVCRA